MGLGDQLPFQAWTQRMAGTEHDSQSTAAEINKCDLDCLVWIIIQLQKSLLGPIHMPTIRRALIAVHSVVHRSCAVSSWAVSSRTVSGCAVSVWHGFALVGLVQFRTRLRVLLLLVCHGASQYL
jgi:hypothetical protein